MEKLPGVQLRHLWPSLTMSERLMYLRQLVEWLHTLYAVPRPGGDRTGLASLRLDDDEAILPIQTDMTQNCVDSRDSTYVMVVAPGTAPFSL